MFRRRDTRPIVQALSEAVWPRGGWARAWQYLSYRLRRLPGTPEEIGRGIFAGIFVSFLPLYGLHFFAAAFLAYVMRGKIIAALLGTFLANPLTYFPIAVLTLRLGYAMLGLPQPIGLARNVFDRFSAATQDLWHNFTAIFTSERVEWGNLIDFWHILFLPWTIGALLPGVVSGLIGYYLAVPLVRSYQARRSARLRKKMEKLRSQAGADARDG